MISGLLLLALLQAAPAETPPPAPRSLPRFTWPRANPYTKAKADLGRKLFFDASLSSDGKTSCATCHVPVRAFGSSRALPPMAGGREGTRNAPSLINRAYGRVFGWDGRWDSIESAISGHFEVRGFMGRPLEQAVPDQLEAKQALGTWIRTLMSGDGPFDKYMGGNREAMTVGAARGKDLFFGKANCIACHKPPLFGADEFAANGAGTQNPPDPGRGGVTRMESDYRLFRIPGLREIAKSAPYFHDGSVATLEEVVAFYSRGGELTDNPDPRLKPLGLTEMERRDLVEFLNALGGEGWQGAMGEKE